MKSINLRFLVILFSFFAAVCPLMADEIVQNFSGEFIRKVVRLEGMKDSRANSMCMDGNILYCASTRYIYALDTSSNPLEPVLLSHVELYGLVRQMVVQDGVLYVTGREAGVWLVDVSDPKNMKIITRYDPVELATGLEVAGDVMFLGTRQNGVECVDVSDPANPVHIRMEKTDESQSVTYRDGILYSGEWGKHCITVIDAKDMSSLKTICTVNLQGHGDGVWTYGNYLYAATGHHLSDESFGSFEERKGRGHGLEIFDITDPEHPVFLSRIGFDRYYFATNDYWTPRPCSGGRYVLVADTYNGLYVVDAHDPSNLSIVSRLTFTSDNAKPAPVTSLAVGKGVVYVSVSGGAGFYAVECPEVVPEEKFKGRKPLNPGFRYDYQTSEDSRFKAWKPASIAPVRGVAANGDILYAACSYGGMAILRQKKNGEIEHIGNGPMAFAGDVKVQGNLLWVAEGFNGLAVYRIGRGADLTFIARYTDFFKDGPQVACQWVFTPTDKIVAAGPRTGRYYYLNVENLPEIKFMGYVGFGPGWDKYPSDKADSKGWYPSTKHRTGIMWINLNENKLKQTKDNAINPSLTSGICLFRNDSFLTCAGRSIYTYTSDKKMTVSAKSEGFVGMPAWDGGDRVAMTYRMQRQISMVEYKEGSEPILQWKESTCGYPETSVFWKGKLAVPCGYQGLLIEK